MLPPACADHLDRMGHDAVSVLRIGMAATDDGDVFDHAAEQGRVVVTENFADFADILAERQNRGAPSVPIVVVRRDSFPRRGALANHLAQRLHEWSQANPEPYVGLYWA